MTEQHDDARSHEAVLLGLRRGDPDACRLAASWARRSITQPRFAIPRDDVEDLVQDALAQVLVIVRQPDFTIRVSLQALVRRVAMARSVDAARRRRPMVELPPDLSGDHVAHDERLVLQDELQQVRDAVATLSDLCRDLIRWIYHDDLSYRAIAERTGRHPGTLRVHMFKCLQHLRKQFDVCDN